MGWRTVGKWKCRVCSGQDNRGAAGGLAVESGAPCPWMMDGGGNGGVICTAASEGTRRLEGRRRRKFGGFDLLDIWSRPWDLHPTVLAVATPGIWDADSSVFRPDDAGCVHVAVAPFRYCAFL
jgi:hypothetical protein